MEKIFTTIWMLFGIYMMVLLAILADLWSGVRKAKKNGVARSSYGYKRTVDKIARYYNMLLALTIIDAMQMSSVWYLEVYYNYSFPLFPFVTLIGALGIGLIELKSIYEKAEDKVRIDDAIHLFSQVANNKKSIELIAKEVGEYLKQNHEKN